MQFLKTPKDIKNFLKNELLKYRLWKIRGVAYIVTYSVCRTKLSAVLVCPREINGSGAYK